MPAIDRDVVIVADGDVDLLRLAALLRPAEGALDAALPLVIAADGGAAKALAAGVRPDIVIGDGDSLTIAERERLAGLGVEVRTASVDKDESDSELCLAAAVQAGATRITMLGALGGDRPEHGIANVLQLADPRLDGRDVVIADGATVLTRMGRRDGPGTATIEGRAGDFVSLFPLGDRVEGIRTEGLRFALHDETLEQGPSRGLSNELLGAVAHIRSARGRLLIVHTATKGA